MGVTFIKFSLIFKWVFRNCFRFCLFCLSALSFSTSLALLTMADDKGVTQHQRELREWIVRVSNSEWDAFTKEKSGEDVKNKQSKELIEGFYTDNKMVIALLM